MLQSFRRTYQASRLWNDESGQDLVEYALLGALIAVTCIASIGNLVAGIQAAFTAMGAHL